MAAYCYQFFISFINIRHRDKSSQQNTELVTHHRSLWRPGLSLDFYYTGLFFTCMVRLGAGLASAGCGTAWQRLRASHSHTRPMPVATVMQ